MNANRIYGALAVVFLLGAATHRLQAQTFSVSASGLDAYVISSQFNPTLTLLRGVTYVFVLNGLSIHPFWIKTAPSIGFGDAYNNGVVNNGSTSANVTFNVPANAPNTLFYHCGNHTDMGGQIDIITPLTPPTVKVVFIIMDPTNITIKSTGATNWSAFPEYKCALTNGAWLPVATFTNVLANNTNTTTFKRSEVICGPGAFLRIRNQQN